MPRLNFPPFAPDVSDLNAASARLMRNAVPRADGYGPFKSLQAFTDALPAACRGYYFARHPDSTVSIFAGTINNLYLLNNTTLAWDEVSKGGVDYTDLNPTANWVFAQFGNVVIAVQANTAPQAFDIVSDSEFDDLGGSPPDAGHVAVVGPFLVLSDLASDPNAIEWSGLNAITTWDGTNSSDTQPLSDGGRGRCVVSLGEDVALILQDSAVRRMQWAPGDERVFIIDKLENVPGVLAPYSVVTAPGGAYFLSSRGFVALDATGALTPIGEERVNRTFLNQHEASVPADVLALAYDDNNPQLVIGAVDPKRSLIVWAYKSAGSAGTACDRALLYHFMLKRWAPVELAVEYIAPVAQPGLTLEALDSIASSIEDLPFSLDDVSTSTLPNVSAVGLTHAVGFFSGATIEAELDTAEQSLDGQRMNINALWPITDADQVYGSVLTRDRQNMAWTEGSESLIDDDGRCPLLDEGRYVRARLRFPAGAVWSFATGANPEAMPAGEF